MFDRATATRSRMALLSVVMLGILVVSIGIAWWVARGRSGDTATGEQVVNSIRTSGLKAFWKDRPASQNYLIRDGGKVVGWQAHYRYHLPRSGGFMGMEMRRTLSDRGQFEAWEVWSLNADATIGAYTASDSITPFTSILLDNGHVQAVQTFRERVGRVQRGSSAPAPANYLPEGTMRLGMFLLARRKSDAYFRMLFNSQHPMPGEQANTWITRFVPVRVEYKGQEKIKTAGKEVSVSVVSMEAPGEGSSEHKFYIGEDGVVLREAYGSQETVAVSQAELEKAFPGATQAVQGLLARHIRSVVAQLDQMTKVPTTTGK